MANLFNIITNNLVKGFHPYYKGEPDKFKSEKAFYDGEFHNGVWVVGFPTIVNGKLAIDGRCCQEFTDGLNIDTVVKCIKKQTTMVLFVEMQTFSKCLGYEDTNNNLIFENDYLVEPNADMTDRSAYEVVRFGRIGNIQCFYTASEDKIFGGKPLIVDVNIVPNINEYKICGTIFDNKYLYKMYG